MFVRRKTVRGKAYFALVESHRVNGKVKQRVLLSLGRHASIEKCLEWERWMLAEVYRKAAAMKHGFVIHNTMREDPRQPGYCLRSFASADESSSLKAIKTEAKVTLLEHYLERSGTSSLRAENVGTT